MGQIGKWAGKVFKNYRLEDLGEVYGAIDPYCLRYGLDFGYFPDPCAFVEAGLDGGNIYVFRERVVDEADNDQLAEIIRPVAGERVVWCDSASPDRIATLRKLGVNARSVGKKRVEYSVLWLNKHPIIIDDACRQSYGEIDNYARKADRNGDPLPVFQDGGDHCIDALRYALCTDMNSSGEIKGLHLDI